MVPVNPPVVEFELDSDEITLSRFLRAAQTFLSFIVEVATDVVGRDGVHWVIEDVSKNSPLHLEVRPVGAREGVKARQLMELTSAISRGIATVQARPERPRHFSDRALENVKELAELGMGEGVRRVRIGGRRPTRVTAQLIANVDAILGETITSIGTIEGRLESINVHGTRVFVVYDSLTGERIPCYFGHRIDVAEVGQAVERRVAVQGEIKYRDNGEIVRVVAHDLSVFPREEELPSADQVRGILRA